MHFAPARPCRKEADDAALRLGDEAVPAGDQAAMLIRRDHARRVDCGAVGVVGESRGRLAFDTGERLGIFGARQPDRERAHSSVRISTVSPISRNRKNGAQAARKGGYPPKLPIASAALSTTK